MKQRTRLYYQSTRELESEPRCEIHAEDLLDRVDVRRCSQVEAQLVLGARLLQFLQQTGTLQLQ